MVPDRWKFRVVGSEILEEILPHKKEIDIKYAHLFKAPTEDPEGNKAIIRYSRKTKEQYVQTEIDGKPSGWKAFYENGKWVVQEAKAKPKAKAKAKAKPKAKAKAKAKAKPKAKK